MKREELITRLCRQTTRVAHERFRWTAAADCFCGDPSTHQVTDQEVVDFIEQAIDEKLDREA